MSHTPRRLRRSKTPNRRSSKFGSKVQVRIARQGARIATRSVHTAQNAVQVWVRRRRCASVHEGAKFAPLDTPRLSSRLRRDDPKGRVTHHAPSARKAEHHSSFIIRHCTRARHACLYVSKHASLISKRQGRTALSLSEHATSLISKRQGRIALSCRAPLYSVEYKTSANVRLA